MKKLILFLFLAAFSIAAFCSVSDSTMKADLVGIGLSSTVAWMIVTGLGLLLGHVAIPSKFASILFYIQKGIGYIQDLLTWLNEKTNNGQKTNFYKKTATILVIGLFSLGICNAQSLFSPLPQRVKSAIVQKEANYSKAVFNNLKSTALLSSDSTAKLFSLTASVNAFAYEIGPASGGKIMNGAGIGASWATFKMINGKALPIWDISGLFMTNVKMTDLTFTGAGGMVAIGFNPGYLVGIGGNTIIREGIAYIGTQGFTNMKWYLTTSVGINF
jgi:hypothetical protein